MWLLKNCSRGFYLCLLLLLTLAISSSAIAYADSGSSATAMVKAGSLTESNATNQVKLNVMKQARMASYTLPITVIDATGSGSGWHLMITSTTFRITNDQKDANKNLLPTNASRITGVSVSCGTHSTCTNPGNSISYPLLIPAGNTPPPPTTFFDAAVGSGLGKFLVVMMVNVSIPAKTDAGVYVSTLTLTIANGP